MASVLKYLRQVFRHKWFVFIEACRLGVPWLGLIHDGSKFGIREMLPYARYFYGNYSTSPEVWRRCPSYTGRTKQDVSREFDAAWNDHQKRNRHHWQYWVLINDRSEPQISALPMPERYIREMVADWRGAGRAYGNPDTAGWYEGTKDKQIMHTDTRRRVDELLYD
jgi:hypothetical protein